MGHKAKFKSIDKSSNDLTFVKEEFAHYIEDFQNEYFLNPLLIPKKVVWRSIKPCFFELTTYNSATWVGPTPKSNETVLKAEVDAFGVYNWLKTKNIRK